MRSGGASDLRASRGKSRLRPGSMSEYESYLVVGIRSAGIFRERCFEVF
jgi:hypothetical protein